MDTIITISRIAVVDKFFLLDWGPRTSDLLWLYAHGIHFWSLVTMRHINKFHLRCTGCKFLFDISHRHSIPSSGQAFGRPIAYRLLTSTLVLAQDGLNRTSARLMHAHAHIAQSHCSYMHICQTICSTKQYRVKPGRRWMPSRKNTCS